VKEEELKEKGKMEGRRQMNPLGILQEIMGKMHKIKRGKEEYLGNNDAREFGWNATAIILIIWQRGQLVNAFQAEEEGGVQFTKSNQSLELLKTKNGLLGIQKWGRK
jgi:hypothetical protein